MSQNHNGENANSLEDLLSSFGRIMLGTEANPEFGYFDLFKDTRNAPSDIDQNYIDEMLAVFDKASQDTILNHILGGSNVSVDPFGAIVDFINETARIEAEKVAEREACMSRHPAGKRQAKTTTRVVVEDTPIKITTDEKGTKFLTIKDPTVTFVKEASKLPSPDVVNYALDYRVEAVLPYSGEIIPEDSPLLDHVVNVGLMIEDRNKTVFMFDEFSADNDDNLAFAWFAWGDTKPSYPAFPVRVIRVP